MAIVQNPITGRTKKKFGSAVFSKQFGKNTMRYSFQQRKDTKKQNTETKARSGRAWESFP